MNIIQDYRKNIEYTCIYPLIIRITTFQVIFSILFLITREITNLVRL